jgi:dolichyl-phosphate beta-glucosyltransferase
MQKVNATGSIANTARCRLSIVIPALNEESRIPATLTKIIAYLETADDLLPAEIIVVDDGSTDRTAEIVRQVSSTENFPIVLGKHPSNRGKGAAVRTGFSLSQGQDLLICDADLSTPIEEIEVLLKSRCGESVVIGSRAVDRNLILIHQPWYRDIMGRTFNTIQQNLAVRGIVDTQCGFKLYPGDLGRELAKVQRLDGFAFDVELLLIARSWHCTIVETGVRWSHVEASRVLPLKHSIQMFRDLLRLWSWRISRRLPKRPNSLPCRS